MSDKYDSQSTYKQVTDMLEKGVKEVFTSERYKEYLSFVSKFHKYSYNNCILIMLQKPNASLVAGFNDWKKHDRYVKKGEKGGIKIIAPTPYKIKVAVPIYGEDNQPVIANGKPLTELKEVQKLGFKVVSVFDVSQTDGKPLPTLTNELTSSVEKYNYTALFDAITATSPYAVEFSDSLGDAKGMCSYNNRTTYIKRGMSEAQTIKTHLHERTHSRLHEPTDEISGISRRAKEVQAESVAFVVANRFGIDTSDYSFSYIANWSSDMELSELKQSLETIQKEASDMIQIIENKYAELVKTIEKEASAMIDGIQEKSQEFIKSKERETSFDNPDIAFANAINKGLEHPENYMFMYSANGYDYFKHNDTREYISFPQGNEKIIEQPIESIIEQPTQFYGMISYAGSTSMDTIPAFYDNFSDYSAELNYQKSHPKNFGTILTKEQFIANISKSIASAGHSFNIGFSLKGIYVDEISDWLQKHPSEADIPPALAEWSHKVTTVHQWENNNNIDESNRLTCKEMHTGQILTLHNDDKLLEDRYAEILSSQEVKKSTTVLSDTKKPSISDKTTVAIESTEDYSDTNLHQELIDIDIKNADGTYGKTQNSYRLVTLDKNGTVTPYSDDVFKNKQEALEYVNSNANKLTVISYDDMIHQAGNIKFSHTEKRVSKQKYDKEENKRIVAQIKELPIQDYAQYLGFTVQQIGTYYTLKEHDSVRIDTNKNRFVRNSTGAKGSVIDFAMEFEKLDKQSAISKLAKYIGADNPIPLAHATRHQSISKPKSKKLTLPPKAENMKNVFAYLINTRRIDSEIVSQWVHNKNLYQDNHKNCVFVTYDKDGNPEFASQRGTNTHKPFKADVPGSNYDTCHFINNNASKLIIGEAVIDIMSVQTILKSKGRDLQGYNYLSLNGVTKVNAVLNALNNSPTDTVILATDNDNAGKQARIELQALISEYDKNIKIIEYVPKNEKDWNAELVTNVLKEEQSLQSAEPSVADSLADSTKEANLQNLSISINAEIKPPNKNQPNL